MSKTEQNEDNSNNNNKNRDDEFQYLRLHYTFICQIKEVPARKKMYLLNAHSKKKQQSIYEMHFDKQNLNKEKINLKIILGDFSS